MAEDLHRHPPHEALRAATEATARPHPEAPLTSQADYEAWRKRPLTERYVYLWADRAYLDAGLEPKRSCGLVVLGARSDGVKELWPSSSVTARARSRGPACCAACASVA